MFLLAILSPKIATLTTKESNNALTSTAGYGTYSSLEPLFYQKRHFVHTVWKLKKLSSYIVACEASKANRVRLLAFPNLSFESFFCEFQTLWFVTRSLAQQQTSGKSKSSEKRIVIIIVWHLTCDRKKAWVIRWSPYGLLVTPIYQVNLGLGKPRHFCGKKVDFLWSTFHVDFATFAATFA